MRRSVNPETLAPTQVMGVLNVTPNSFSDGGRYSTLIEAVEHGRELVKAGASIVDVGGEATWPGVQRTSPEDECERVLAVIRQLSDENIRVSVDTMNASTASAALEAGATIVNDVSGGLADPAMGSVVAQNKALFVVTHWRGHSSVANDHAQYTDPVNDVLTELSQRIDALIKVGASPEQLILDPGFGFSKNSEHNWRILAELDRFIEYGFPVLVGVSRKRFLADVVPPHAPVHFRDVPTAVITSFVADRVWAVRVHDVAGSVSALRVHTTLNTAQRATAVNKTVKGERRL